MNVLILNHDSALYKRTADGFDRSMPVYIITPTTLLSNVFTLHFYGNTQGYLQEFNDNSCSRSRHDGSHYDKHKSIKKNHPFSKQLALKSRPMSPSSGQITNNSQELN